MININNIKKNYSPDIIPILFISIFPLTLLIGPAASNICVSLVILFFLFNLFKEKNIKIFKNNTFFLFIFFWLFLFFSLIFSINFYNSFGRALSFGSFVFFSYAISYFLKSKKYKYINLIFLSWSIIVFAVAIDCIYEFILGHDIIGNKSALAGRISSFLGKELKIGHFFLGFAPMTIAYIYSKKIEKKYLLIFLFVLSNVISFIIGERSNFIRFFIETSILVIALNKIEIRKIILLLLIAISFFTLIVISNNNYRARFFPSEITNKEKFFNYIKSTQYIAHYDTALKIIKNYPLTGIGLKNFYFECGDEKYINSSIPANNVRCSTHPHQHHLEIFSEIGIFGYLLFLYIFINFLINNFSYIKNTQNPMPLVSYLYVSIFLFAPIPTGSFFTSWGASIFWLNIGIILAFKKNS
jgi:O-antigen ligase